MSVATIARQPLRALSLFSGAGGADMALEAAGIAVVGLCEIEPHARAVLRYHWPHVTLHGDVSQLDGTPYRGLVDIIVGGSPCQDLSVTGKRAGLSEGSGTRSALFHDQVRIWRESGATYNLWENVDGAFSSSGGADFAAVLSALVGSTITVPRTGWAGKRGGVVCGRDAVAAWRVLDLQHFGVPQRRERVVVLAARAGGVDPAEVLALSEGVRWDSAPRFATREGAPRLAQGGPRGHGGAWSDVADQPSARGGDGRGGGGVAPNVPVAGTLGAGGKNTGSPTEDLDRMTFVVDENAGAVPSVAHTLGTPGGGANDQARVTFVVDEVAGALLARHAQGPDSDGSANHMVIQPIAGCLTRAYADKLGLEDQHINAGAPNYIIQPVAHTLTAGGHDASEDGTGRGTPNVVQPVLAFHQKQDPISEEHISPAISVTSSGMGLVAPFNAAQLTNPNNRQTVTPGASAPSLDGTGQVGVIALDGLGVRMLTPRECERIMGWPDDWTRWGVNEAGVTYELKDTPRYRLCGNGIGREWLEWTALRLRAAVESLA